MHMAAETAAEGDVASVRQDTTQDALAKETLVLAAEFVGLSFEADLVDTVDAAGVHGEEIDEPPRVATGAAGGALLGLPGAWREVATAAAGPCGAPRSLSSRSGATPWPLAVKNSPGRARSLSYA